jgi:hypothetical protein
MAWGSETRIRSRGGAVVLVDEPAEHVPAANITRTDRHRDPRHAEWRGEADGAMRSPAEPAHGASSGSSSNQVGRPIFTALMPRPTFCLVGKGSRAKRSEAQVEWRPHFTGERPNRERPFWDGARTVSLNEPQHSARVTVACESVHKELETFGFRVARGGIASPLAPM